MPNSDPSDNIKTLLNQLGTHVEQAGRASFAVEGVFRIVVRAAIVKTYEFAVFAQNDHPDAFFFTPSLRGLCEDLIVLSFLKPLPERDTLVEALNQQELAETLSKQRGFFESRRPWQPVVCDKSGQLQSANDVLRDLAQLQAWPKNRLPTVRYMAEKCSLIALYDFMYSATSKWVHCSPHILLRMGWGGGDGESISNETYWRFSTKHFDKYYNEFNRVYSIYLLMLLIKEFFSEFGDVVAVQALVDKLESENNRILRWPELVTYEELNLEPPSVIIRIALRVAAGHKDEST